MTLPFVPTDSGNEKQHRTVLATTINELVRNAPFQVEPGDVRRFGAKGDGVTDDTAAFTACLAACSGAPYRMYVPKPRSKYKVGSLTIPDNLSAYFEGGTILEAVTGLADAVTLLNFDGASNVNIDFNGAVCQMLKSEYVSGEHRHCFNLINCTDVTLREPVAKDSGGDGFYINGATRLTLHSPWADNNRRNNMSVISATTLRVTGICRLSNANGTAPQDGLDIEPNSDADDLIDIVFETILAEGNASNAVEMYLDDYKDGSPNNVSISIGKIISRDNAQAFRIRNAYVDSGSYTGFIDIGEIVSMDESSNAVFIQDKGVSAPFLKIGKVTAINPCTGSSSFADTGAVYIADTSATVTGGIHIGSVSATATHTDMDYGVILECGAGFTDLRVGVENITGFQVGPVRWNNSTTTVADNSTAIVSVDKLTPELALTSNTTILPTIHMGNIITNTGASGAVSHTLSATSVPPPKNPYRFRVTAAQTMVIDVGASDRIVGTSGTSVQIESSAVGAEIHISFAGTYGGVRYWHAVPQGSGHDWVLNGSDASGTYTPTLTSVTNLAASTAYECQYMRIGRTVTVSGRVDIDPTAAASTSLGISLPVASNLGAPEDCAGTAFASGIAGQGAAIRGDATNNRAEMIWVASDITNQPMYFTFSYQII